MAANKANAKGRIQTFKFSEIGGEYAGIDKKVQSLQEQIKTLQKRKALLERDIRTFLEEHGSVEYLGTVFFLDLSGLVQTMECKSAYDEYIEITEEIPPEENDE